MGRMPAQSVCKAVDFVLSTHGRHLPVLRPRHGHPRSPRRRPLRLAIHFLGGKPITNSILAHRISGKQNIPNVMKPEIIKPLNFRCALVIEQTDSLRMSLVQALKAKGWFVHGIRRPEQAFHILAHIPYRLVVIGSELPGIGGIDFVRILRNSREWRTIPAVVITSSQSVDFATQAAECDAFLARKSTWKDDLFSFLSGYDEDPTKNTDCD